MFNELFLFGCLSFCWFVFSAGAYNGVASGAAECVVRSCVIPQRGGRLAGRPGHAELEEDKPNSLFPLVPEQAAYLVMNLLSLPRCDAAAATGGWLQEGFLASKCRALMHPLKL